MLSKRIHVEGTTRRGNEATDLDGSENNTPIRMLELRNNPLTNQLQLLLPLSRICLLRILILSNSVENSDSPPLCTFAQRDQ